MTIKTKLIVAVSLLFIMLATIGGAGFLALSSATENTRSIVVDRVVPLAQLREVADAFAVDIVDTAHKVAAGSISSEDGSKHIRNALVIINKNWSEYRATKLTETEAALGDDFDKLMAQSKAGIDELLALTDTGDLAAIDEYRRTKLYPLIDPLAEPISKLVALQIDVANAEFAASVAAKNQFNIAMAAMALIALAVVAFAIDVALRGVSRPLDILRRSMEDLAAGQLETDIVGDNRADEVGAMARTMLVFKDNALERRALEARAETSRQAVEGERQARERQKEIDAANTLAAVNHLAEGLDKLAGGQLTWRINQPFVAELDRLRIVYNDAIARLEKAMISVGNNARGIAAGSREILSAATDLSRRTEQQAASVEETAAAVEQITTNVSDSASRAAEAGRLVDKTRSDAEASSAIVRQAIDAMSRIENSSKEISSIIGVIDEIAFQTNLLALNAGVEAARAGDAGKGFAVVAQEVRELAQRSAKAAKEIKALINTSGEQVRGGVDLVARTGDALEAIAAQVVAINRNVSAIVEGAREQAIGLKEINHAVNTMDQGTQKNAAMVEESTAASHSLAREAESLFDLLSSFKTGEEREASAQRDRAA